MSQDQDPYNFMNLTITFPLDNSSIITLKDQIKDPAVSLLNIILSIDIGQSFSSVNLSYLQINSKILDKFKSRHKSAPYSKFFLPKKLENRQDYFNKNRKVKNKVIHHYTESKKCQNQVHIAQVREGFRTILHRIITEKLIGNGRNKKKILKTLHNLLLTARDEPFSLLNLIQNINISSIIWLQDIQYSVIKHILVAKFIKWLFQYFIMIVYNQFHIVYFNKERILILNKDWKMQTRRFINKMKKKKVFLQCPGRDNNIEMKSKLMIIPKYSGVRCIVRHKCQKLEKDFLRKMLSVLYSLYENKFSREPNEFVKKYQEIVINKNKVNHKIYIVTADISNAYGSIIQAKLYSILLQMFEELPPILQIQTYKTKNIVKYKFINPNVKVVQKNTEIPEKKVSLLKTSVLSEIKYFLFNTQIRYKRRVFNLKKGIAQGLMLSSILCDIYYAHMRKEYFSQFENNGYLFTYVDDSIYLSNDQDNANKYLKMLQRGIPEYNCWFNKTKLQNNIDIVNNQDVQNSEKIEYLGWRINCRTLEVEPKYLSGRYCITFNKLTYLNLEKKLKNLASLKISKLIFSRDINSNKQILKNVQNVAFHHAKRCYAFISSLSQKHTSYLTIIQKSSFKVISKIEQIAQWDKKNLTKWRRRLWYIMWKCFYSVFVKKYVVFKYLITSFKMLMKKYK